MTLANLMPIRFTLRDKPTGKRRQDDAVDLLQCKLTGARMLIKGLRLQLDDQAREHEATVRRIDERHAEIVRGLEQQVADLERRLAIACQASAAADQTQEIDPETVRRICAQPVPLYEAPFATVDPGDVRPSWARTP